MRARVAWLAVWSVLAVAAPLHVVRIHGVDMAWIYRAPPEVAQARAAEGR